MKTTHVLTLKQKSFCLEYLVDYNATQAAIRAGYSQKTAYSIGHENLKKVEIREFIKSKTNEMFELVGLSGKRIVYEILQILFNTENKTEARLTAAKIALEWLESGTSKMAEDSKTINSNLVLRAMSRLRNNPID